MDVLGHWRGIAWFMAHLLTGAIQVVLIRLLSTDYPITQIVFLNCAIGLLTFMPIIIAKGFHTVRTPRIKGHLVRGAMSVGSFVSWVTAVSLIPLADAAALAQTTPLLTTILAVLINKERLGPHRFSTLIIGLLGALIILRPGTDAFQYGSIFVLLAVVIRSSSDIFSKILIRRDSAFTCAFYILFGTTIFSWPFALPDWQPLTGIGVFLFVSLGVSGAFVTYAMIKAFEHEDLTVLSPFAFVGLLLMAASGYFFFGEAIDLYTLIGGGIIIATSVYMVHRQHTRAKRRLVEQMTDPGEI